MSKVALLLPYKLCGSQGPEIYLQLHSSGSHWRFFGGHIEKNETPLDSIIRETKEELNIKLSRQEASEGWTVPQLISRLRVPLSRIFLFPIEANDTFPLDGFEIREGLDGRFWPVKALPSNMSLSDKLLIKMWILRRFVLNQPYMVTPLKCPVITIDLEEPYHYAGRIENSRLVNRDYKLGTVIEELLAQLELTESTATFFCVASTAKKYPKLIREITQKGHEVASHGTYHQLVNTQTLMQFREDIRTSREILEDITQQEVVGYRAPAWSWPHNPKQRKNLYETLANVGYRYDSSVIPAAIIGILGLPAIPCRTDGGIWEFPLSVFGVPIVTKNLDRFAKDGHYVAPRHVWRGSVCAPYSGGLFKRCLGSSISNFLLSYHLKKKGYAMTYIHLSELTGEDASWVRSLDDRYLNLFERWFVGFRTKRFKSNFFLFLAKYSGCSIRKFLHIAYGL
jgi:peptidoglycan/xylan/chitin deacetylase (PgdA/CDA1 family)